MREGACLNLTLLSFILWTVNVRNTVHRLRMMNGYQWCAPCSFWNFGFTSRPGVPFCIWNHVPIAKNFKFASVQKLSDICSICARVCVGASLITSLYTDQTSLKWIHQQPATLCMVSDFVATYLERRSLKRQTAYTPVVSHSLSEHTRTRYRLLYDTASIGRVTVYWCWSPNTSSGI